MKSSGFNPLLGVDPESDTFGEDAMAIAESYVIAEDTRDPHWNSSACEFLRMVVMYECTKPEPSLANVRDMLCLPYEALEEDEEERDPAFERVMPLLDKVGTGNDVA